MALRTSANPLSPGTVAPRFTLRCNPYSYASLSDYAGRLVVLSFFSEDWCPVCLDQLTLLRDFLPEIEECGAAVVAVSVDGPWSHRSVARAHNLAYTILSDSRPRGAVARAYGVFDESEGTARRSLFVIDGDGVIAWSEIYPADLNPGAIGILNRLRLLKH
jgi:peroxiredoxin